MRAWVMEGGEKMLYSDPVRGKKISHQYKIETISWFKKK